MTDWEFNIFELLAELEADESWEPDPELRKVTVMSLRRTITGI